LGLKHGLGPLWGSVIIAEGNCAVVTTLASGTGTGTYSSHKTS
jgi:hypothetical protein